MRRCTDRNLGMRVCLPWLFQFSSFSLGRRGRQEAPSFSQAARQAQPVTGLTFQSTHSSLPDQATATSNVNAFVVPRADARHVRKRKKRLNLMEKTMKKKNETKPTNKPVHRIRVGAVSCSVFVNKTKEGTPFPSAVISRSYKSGDSFKDSNSYGARHLAELAALVAGLQSWMTSNYPEAAN